MEEWINNPFDGQLSQLSLLWRLLIVASVVVVAYLIDYLCAHLLVPAVKKVTQKTKAQWDDILFSEQVVRAFCNILPPVVLVCAFPLILAGRVEAVVMRLCSAYIILITVRALCVLISAIYDFFCMRHGNKVNSLKGIAQTAKIILWVIGIILVVSALFDKSPAYLITGLGAMATVLMLVFQDSIKGLVAGVQLSANDMMHPGDWITMPKAGADGVVIDVTLNTVKVRNWDKTIITIPPYMLVNDSFQNWRGMSESGGRRITRSLNIDMHSIRFCTAVEVKKYVEKGWLPKSARAGEATNLQAYRAFLTAYLRRHADVHDGMMILVRQLQPGPEGLPLQVYCFAATTEWVAYENLQSQLMEYVAASLPQFGLAVYQRTGAFDTQFLGATFPHKAVQNASK